MAYYNIAHGVIEGAVEIGADASIWHYAVVRGDEDSITIGHRAVVHGCTIEDDVLVGMGAIVMNGAKIGHGSTIAAGAVVPGGAEIPPDSLVIGVPGKVRASVRPEQRQSTVENAQRYVALAEKRLEQVE